MFDLDPIRSNTGVSFSEMSPPNGALRWQLKVVLGLSTKFPMSVSFFSL